MTLARIQIRRDTTAGWSAANPVLAAGEPAVDTNLKQMKVGDGATPFSGLPWSTVAPEVISSILATGAAIEDAVDANDAIMASVAADEGSAFSGALTSQIVSVGEANFASPTLGTNTARLIGKLERGVEDASMLFVSDSTGAATTAWIYRFIAGLAARFPAYKVLYYAWNVAGSAYDAAVTVQAGAPGTRTLSVYNAAAPGETTWYFLGSKWPAAVSALDPDFIGINMGHNEGSSAGGTTPSLWRGQYLALTESLAEAHPLAGIVCFLQNPETDNTDQSVRARVYEDIASQRGYGVISALDAFLAVPDWAATMMGDSVHPNLVGYQFWADTVLSQVTFARTARGGGSVIPSALILTGKQLLSNGDFAAFASATPDGFTGVNATISKDVTNYESPNGYSMRLQAASAAVSRVYGQLTTAQARALRGQWITLAVRLRVPSGALTTVGRISLHDGVQAEVRSRAMQSIPVNGFVWRVVSMKVSATATFVQASVYGDSSANGSADVSVDGMYLIRGTLPGRAA